MSNSRKRFLIGLLGFLAWGFFFDAGADFMIVYHGASQSVPSDFYIYANTAVGIATLAAIYFVAEIRCLKP